MAAAASSLGREDTLSPQSREITEGHSPLCVYSRGTLSPLCTEDTLSSASGRSLPTLHIAEDTLTLSYALETLSAASCKEGKLLL